MAVFSAKETWRKLRSNNRFVLKRYSFFGHLVWYLNRCGGGHWFIWISPLNIYYYEIHKFGFNNFIFVINFLFVIFNCMLWCFRFQTILILYLTKSCTNLRKSVQEFQYNTNKEFVVLLCPTSSVILGLTVYNIR